MFTGKRPEAGAERQLLWVDCGEPAVQIRKGNVGLRSPHTVSARPLGSELHCDCAFVIKAPQRSYKPDPLPVSLSQNTRSVLRGRSSRRRGEEEDFGLKLSQIKMPLGLNVNNQC